MTKKVHILRPGPRDERVLVERLREGDVDAFRALHQRFVGRVFGLAQHILGSPAAAEDAAQEVFVRVFRKIASFRGDSSLSTWIHRITVNYCLNQRGKTEPVLDDGRLIAESPSTEDLAETIERRSVAAELIRLLETLPAEKRIPFYLHHVEGASAQEIANIMGESRDAILKRLQRTKSQLEDMWERRTRRSRREGT